MTRFARARGSKASNKKVPKEATSWESMKRQLQESQIEQEQPVAPARRSLQQLLSDDVSDSKTEWSTFPDKKSKLANTKTSKKKMKPSRSSLGGSENETAEKDVLSKTLDGRVKKNKSLKVKKNKVSKMLNDNDKKILDVHVANASAKKKIPKKKKQKSGLLKDKPTHIPSVNENDIKNIKVKGKDRHDGGVVGNKQQKKQKMSKSEKMENGKPYSRRKPLQENMVITVNGKKIALSYFDGFVVMKEDAERLKDLRVKLRAKGIPEAEFKEAIKLERRKAEKALVRERKKVCFQCRNSGHMLSECPELTSANGAIGICFKCGSTEHNAFDCRVGKTGRYRFAQCFVCSEQGHISSQCPNNPKGMYPKGGGCYVCGNVNHLKKDCPKLEQENEAQMLTVCTMNGGSLEALDAETKPKSVNNFKHVKKAKRVVF